MKLAREQRLWAGAVILAAAVLITLAALQVHWSRQLRSAARERIGATVKAAMLDWHLDPLRLFSGPALALSTVIDAQEPVAHYLEEYEEGRRSRPTPISYPMFSWYGHVRVAIPSCWN